MVVESEQLLIGLGYAWETEIIAELAQSEIAMWVRKIQLGRQFACVLIRRARSAVHGRA
jgi:hypothetical protein